MPHVGGSESIALPGTTIGELLKNLVATYPSLDQIAKEGIAVSIDGVLYQNSHNQPIPDGAEVYLLPQLKGG